MIQRWIQWRFVLPRLILTGVILLVIWLGTEPALRAFFVGVGQRIIGAKVEIANVDASLANCDLKVAGVRVAHPRDSLRNLIECDSASFDIETGSVLQRRLVVREARLSGVRLNTPRSTSGKLESPPLNTQLPDEFDTQLEDVSKRALRQFARIIQQDLQKELVSIQLLQELSARWPADMKKLESRAAEVRQRIARLRDDVNGALDDPRGAATSFPDKVAEVERLRAELADIRHEIDHLVEQVGRDRIAIEIAQRHDRDTIKRKLTLKDLDPQGISEYLLGEELNAQACELIAWIKLARRYWPSEVAMPEGERSSGADIVFPGVKQLPKALVQRMLLDGTIQRGERTVPWRGEISHLTTDPALIVPPLVIRAETGGAHPLVMEATLDRTGKSPRDLIVISIPEFPQPPRMLGNAEEIALAVAPGKMHIWAQLHLDGEALTGRVLLEQKELKLSPQLPEKFGQRLASRVAGSLHQVSSLQAEVSLGGTLDKPTWKLRSNLGPQVAAGLSQALRGELEARELELIAKLDRYLIEQQTQFDKLVAADQEKLVAQLDLTGGEIEAAKNLVAGRIKLPTARKLPELPLPNPFFRR